MLNFTKIKKKVTIDNLTFLGFDDGDNVLVIFDGGEVLFGTLDYSKDMFGTPKVKLNLSQDSWDGREMFDAVGIAKVGFTC